VRPVIRRSLRFELGRPTARFAEPVFGGWHRGPTGFRCPSTVAFLEVGGPAPSLRRSRGLSRGVDRSGGPFGEIRLFFTDRTGSTHQHVDARLSRSRVTGSRDRINFEPGHGLSRDCDGDGHRSTSKGAWLPEIGQCPEIRSKPQDRVSAAIRTINSFTFFVDWRSTRGGANK